MHVCACACVCVPFEGSAFYFDLCLLGGMVGFIVSAAELLSLTPFWGAGGRDSDVEVIST